MKQNPSWEANSHSASQEILRLCVCVCVCVCGTRRFIIVLTRSHALVPILSQMHPLRAFPPYFPKIHFYSILPSTPMSSEWSLSFRFSKQNIICISYLSYVCLMPRPSHIPWFDHLNNVRWNVQVVKFVMQSSPASSATCSHSAFCT